MFPAYAGMIRLCTSGAGRRWSVPRLRGDDPAEQEKTDAEAKCSPPTRG